MKKMRLSYGGTVMHGGKKDFIFIRTAVPQEKVQHGFLAEAVRFEETCGSV